MNLLEILDRLLPVLGAGLVFGAGLPALFAVGMRLLSGPAEYTADGKLVEIEPAAPAAKFFGYCIFALISLSILIGILWIAKDFIFFMTGFNLFGAAG
ncbi:hypothetical protein [Canibacter oris]|uniref:Uncharacterized protein n=1 Tax=Canibacter oris TaxID=1365628 RepID=A0A840DGK1_9MICO|nr:hypothetical protein [Canibacter oris]MBB4071860.1 hypothetical protein [Canibacter oris]